MDTRTKKNIETLHPKARAWAEAHILAIGASGLLPKGYSVRIISGNRTWAEQNALYAKGRTDSGSIVTNARGGQSNHNFGIAWDIGVFDEKGRYLPESPLYETIGEVGLRLGLEWGGTWRSTKDRPHYQVKTGLSVGELRRLMRAKRPIPVPDYPTIRGADAPRPLIKVYDDGELTDIEAYFEDGRVFVELRRFVNRFGGEVLSASGSNFVVNLDEKLITLTGTTVDGKGFVKFADLNRVLGWGFVFEPFELSILTGE